MVVVIVLAVSHKLALQALLAEYNTLRAWRDMKGERVAGRLRSRQRLQAFSAHNDALA